MTKRLMLFVGYFLISLAVLNLAFPITFYLQNFSYAYSRSYIISSFLLLSLANTFLAGVAFPFAILGTKPRWLRVMRSTALYFVLICAFAISCSGAGFGLSLGELPFFGRLGIFFAEWEWLRFIFESAIPLALFASALYFFAIPSPASVRAARDKLEARG
jgi:hypothetical protein